MRSFTLNFIIVSITIILLISCANRQNKKDYFVFSANEFNFPIDVNMTFTKESENIFRFKYSKSPSQSGDVMLYSYLFMCAARTIAKELDFDRYGQLPEKKKGLIGTVFFLRSNESVSQIMGSQFENVTALPVDYPTISSMCAKDSNKAK